MAIPTDLEIEAAVPTDGTPPNRANTQAVLKSIRDELGGDFPLPLTNTTGPNEFRAQIDLIDTTPIDTASGKFRLAAGGSGNAFTDWNGQLIEDHIFNFGLNFGYGDSTFRHDTTKPSFGVCWESKYWLPGSRQVYATEFGFRGRTEGGNERRLMDTYLPWDGLQYEVAWNAGLFQLGHPVTSAGAMGFQRVKFDLWPNNTVRMMAIAATGTAAGATTNAAGYAAGVSQVTLAAAGTGSLPVDCLFKFDGVGQVYAVEQAVADVSGGGVLRFSPALVAPLSAATHTVVRVSIGAPAMSFETNNQPALKQRNAAGTTDLALPYVSSRDEVVSELPYGMRQADAPHVVKGTTGLTGHHIAQVQDSAGNVLFGVGGTPGGNTTWQGHGWIGLQTSEAVGPGFELRATNGTPRYFSFNLGGDGNLVLRQNTGGAGSTYLDVTNNLYVRAYNAGNALLMQLSTTKAAFSRPVGLPSYANVAALPTAASVGAGALAHVAATTTPGGACIIASDGAVWKVVVALGGATTVA